MALDRQKPSIYNRMWGQRIKHPESTNYYSDCDEEDSNNTDRPAKRLKSDSQETSKFPTTLQKSSIIPESETEADESDGGKEQTSKATDLESALPPVSTDQEAIDEYEAARAARDSDRGEISARLNSRKWVKGKTSIYVDAFKLALDTVLAEESHLFDLAERALFEYWDQLSYEAQYLYVRLFLRKTSAWHRINSLGYYSDIADLETAITELQQSRSLPESDHAIQGNPGELEPPPGTALETDFTFADKSDLITSLEEASSLLKLDELKSLAKDAKVHGKNKKELLEALRRTSKQQTGLKSMAMRRSDTASSVESASTTAAKECEDNPTNFEDPERNRDAHFLQKILDETGPFIRLSLAPLRLFERVHLVFYRSTEWTEKSLTTIILARISRRNFPEYIVSRSARIFDSRALLVEFEASLRTQFRVDAILEGGSRPTAQNFLDILDIFDQVYPRWRALLQEEELKENRIYHSGEGAYLRRLSPAWVYTRIVHKAAYVFGRLKKHEKEHELLTELLAQRLFHHSRRGAWSQRKALIEEHYLSVLGPSEGRDKEAQKKHWVRVAHATCEEGLQDPLVHLIYHHDLQKRVVKLEKALRIPKREQHDFSHVQLAAPVEVYVEGTKVEREASEGPSFSRRGSGSGQSNATARGMKTVWLDPLEGNGECSVEAMCLSHYRSQGWRGYHSEGGIVRTLFAYLFYDILFTYVPNVFQTPFQTCPLDLHTDGFYPTRLSEINHRLVQIGNGSAVEMIKNVWNEHFERKTCVIGLDWSYELDDLLEIADLFNGQALATVCKVMAQEYGTRGGGLPDLFLWHPEKKQVMFSEVKSENDRLSDTQRMWIHVLTGAGVSVELCHAVAKGRKEPESS